MGEIYNVPLEYWNGDGLSRIASAVGIPLFMDHLTSSGSRISFARVCVDIPADSTFPDRFDITSRDASITIHVEYQGVPSRCVHCHVYGHETKTCLSAQVTKLIELQKSIEDRVEPDEGWTKVKDKGKRKASEQSSPALIDPTEVTSSSNGRGDDQEIVFHSEVADIQTGVVEIAATATDHVAAFHSEVLEIAKTLNPAAEGIIQSMELEGKDVVSTGSPEMQGGKVDSGRKGGSSNKQKSSGKASGSQKKKKR